MPPKQQKLVLAPLAIESRIQTVRGQRVMLDFHLAELSHVPTMRLNEQVARNRDRFPEDFAFQVSENELNELLSQNAISTTGRGGRRKRPWVFPEHGVAMLGGVLNSETAIRVNIAIIRAFVRMRRLFAVPGDLVRRSTSWPTRCSFTTGRSRPSPT